MAFQILNDPSAGNNAATYIEQARPDAGDISAIVSGVTGTGVLSGCAVSDTGATPTMAVSVGAGEVSVGDGQFSVPAVNLTIAAADATNPRVDLVVASPSGASVVQGTPAATPAWPAVPAGSVVLAHVTVPPNATSVAAANLVDKRLTPAVPVRRRGMPQLAPHRTYSASLEYQPAPAAGSSVNILSLPAGTSGVIRTIWWALETDELTGRIQVSYDQEASPSFDVELGVLMLQYPGNGVVTTEHVHGDTSHGVMRFPMPFGDGVSVDFYVPPSGAAGSNIWFRVEYELWTESVPEYRLRSTSMLYTAQSNAVDEYVSESYGYLTLSTPNLLVNGGPQTLVAPAVGQLFKLQRKGWAVYLAYTADYSSQEFLERNFNWYIDGDVLPTFPPNLVSSVQDSSFEGGVGGWVNGSDATIVSSSAQAYAGSDSGLISYTSDSANATAYANAIMSYTPTVYYKLDDAAGSTTVADSSGNGNTGTSVSGVTFQAAPSPAGEAANFNVGSISMPVNPVAPFTFTAWVNTSGAHNTDGWSWVLGYDPTSGSDAWAGFSGATGGTPDYTTGVGADNHPSTGTVYDGNWHHMAWTLDASGNLTIYKDGVSVLAAAGVALPGTGGTSTIGNRGGGTEHFAGDMAQVALIPSVLTASDVQALYNTASNSAQEVTLTPSIPVSSSTDYGAQLWVQAVSGTPPFQFVIDEYNGAATPAVVQAHTVIATPTTTGWTMASTSFTTSSTTVSLQLAVGSNGTAATGNEVAIDEVGVYLVPQQSVGSTGSPSGATVGSPSIWSTGTEDAFYSGFYFDEGSPMSSPMAAYVGSSASPIAASLDILAATGGYRFEESLELWLGSDHDAGTTGTVGAALLFYDDVS